MDKIIPFNKGIRRQPSLGEAGELSECVNLIPQNGELVNVRPMTETGPELGEGEKLLCVHRVQGGENYIVLVGKDIKYYRKSGSEWKEEDCKDEVVSEDENASANVIGNTLIILSKSMHYLLWKDGKYVYLGDHLPELPITFGLVGRMLRETHENIEIYEQNVNENNGVIKLTEENRAIMDKWVIPVVNNFIDKNSIGEGKFVYPFFVRYAYRLYDGSLTMHSAPALMVCSSDFAPQCFVKTIEGTEHGYKLKVSIASIFHTLDYAVSQTDKDKLKEWGDIVKSVDVFISSPISSYDRNGTCGNIISTKMSDCYSICKAEGQRYLEEENLRYQKNMFSLIYATTFRVLEDQDLGIPTYRLELPKKKEEVYKKSLSETSLFYYLKSINLDELATERTKIETSDSILRTLETREVMTDDYISHDELAPSYSSVYNSRLNVINANRTLFRGFQADTMQPYTNGYYVYGSTTNIYKDTKYSVVVYYYIHQEGKEIVVRDESGSIAYGTPFLWLYYPNRNAHKAVVQIVKDVNDQWKYLYEVQLEPHPFLNGAFYMADWGGISEPKRIEVKVTDDKSVEVKNTIFSSQVNNPFYFPAEGSYTIDTYSIMNITSSAKALSQGQFGQFPLYAFCSDGIWALEVANDGSFKAVQPISRDVCNNPDSITQIDGAVVFTTDQGLKLIQGSDVVLLSTHLDGHNVDEDLYFKKAKDGTGFFAKYGMEEFDKLVNPETRDIRDILETCSISYDYVNQLLRIFPKAGNTVPYKYYVYSFTTQEFATVIGNEFANGDGTHEGVTTVVPNYPSSIVQIGNKLCRPMETEREGFHEGLLLTRPLLFDEPFALKKLQDMRLQYSKLYKDKDGNSSKCHVIVYVSNDGKNWAILKSLRGGSYKYFRIAVATNLSDADALTGVIARYELNRTNKLR